MITHETRVVAIDLYGTVMSDDDFENAMPPRPGFAGLVKRAKKLGIKIVTSSDAPTEMQQLDLTATFKGRAGYSLELFDEFYELLMRPKAYDQIIADFGIMPSELMIIGDDIVNDFTGASVVSRHILVPNYHGCGDDFTFDSIDF